MKYDYADIMKQLKSIKGTGEKQRYLQKIINEIRQSGEMDFSEIPSGRLAHLAKKMEYMEDIFILRNILIESYLDEKNRE